MLLADVMKEIEQHHFSAELNLASGTKAFRRGLRAHKLFRGLVELAKNPEARRAVTQRVKELAESEVDTRYENPYDAAMSAYLTVLADLAQPETVVNAATAAAKAPNTWWTVGISREVIAGAIAKGWAQPTPSSWHIVPASLFQGVEWREAPRSTLQQWWENHEVSISPSDEAAKRILSVLRVTQEQAQVPTAANVIVMSPPNEEGERVVRRARGHSRSPRGRPAHGVGSPHSRGRQLARA